MAVGNSKSGVAVGIRLLGAGVDRRRFGEEAGTLLPEEAVGSTLPVVGV